MCAGDVFDYLGQRVDVTEVSSLLIHNELKLNSWDVYVFHLWTRSSAPSSTQNTDVVDFSFNPLADTKFSFHDHSLVEAVKLGVPEVQGFFRLLALCHTVMAEEKSEGTFEKTRSSLLTKAKT